MAAWGAEGMSGPFLQKTKTWSEFVGFAERLNVEAAYTFRRGLADHGAIIDHATDAYEQGALMDQGRTRFEGTPAHAACCTVRHGVTPSRV